MIALIFRTILQSYYRVIVRSHLHQFWFFALFDFQANIIRINILLLLLLSVLDGGDLEEIRRTVSQNRLIFLDEILLTDFFLRSVAAFTISHY